MSHSCQQNNNKNRKTKHKQTKTKQTNQQQKQKNKTQTNQNQPNKTTTKTEKQNTNKPKQTKQNNNKNRKTKHKQTKTNQTKQQQQKNKKEKSRCGIEPTSSVLLSSLVPYRSTKAPHPFCLSLFIDNLFRWPSVPGCLASSSFSQSECCSQYSAGKTRRLAATYCSQAKA